jgi:hypothetical protein
MLKATLVRVLTAPSAAELWRLRADLLEAGVPPAAEVWEVVGEFGRFLDELATRSSSRNYSELASKMDISAISGFLAEQLLEQHDARELAVRVFSGILSEGLMVLATRQHVKAWAGELAAVYRGAAWFLYPALWRWAERLQPELPAAERRRLLDRVFDPLQAEEVSGEIKAALLGRLFQILLLGHLAAAVRAVPARAGDDPTRAVGSFSDASGGCNNCGEGTAKGLAPTGAADGEEES